MIDDFSDSAATRMKGSRLSQAIRDANQAGRLGLVIYMVPGFPSLSAYSEIMAFLDARLSVTAIENTVPVAHGHETANKTIIRAHLIGTKNVQGFSIQELLKGPTPRFAVLYRPTIAEWTYDGFLKEFAGCFDGVVPEWRETETRAYVETSRRHGVEFIQSIAPSLTIEQQNENARLANSHGLVYLGCSTKTGGEMAPVAELRRCAMGIKTLRPDLTIAAGMGIKTADDIRRVAAIPEVDAVVVGTAFLQTMEKGIEEVKRLITELEGALARSPGVGVSGS